MDMEILIEIYFSHLKKQKKHSVTKGHEVTLLKDQCRLDISKHSFSESTINELNKLFTVCVNSGSVNMFKNKIDIEEQLLDSG